VTCIFIWCCFFLLAFSDSAFSTEDSVYRIEDPEVARDFELKKRKLAETGGRPQRRTHQSGKTTAEDSSSAAVGQHMRTKVVQPRGPHPSRRGKSVHRGPVDVEKEK
jgi:hypothetical protein